MQVNYTNKPNIKTLKAAIVKALNSGSHTIFLVWGENQITIEKTVWGLTGSGWIGRNGGQDLAQSIHKGQYYA